MSVSNYYHTMTERKAGTICNSCEGLYDLCYELEN